MLFLLANHFLNWTNILSISESMQSEIPKSAVMVFTYFCLQFVLRIITTLIIGDRQREKSSFVDVLGQIVSLSLILILIKATQGSFVTLGLGLCISPRLVLIAANI